MLTLAGLHVYPVKGLKGVDLDEAAVEPWGLAHDRRWMVVDPEGRFVTQRQVPRLALIAASLTSDGLRLSMVGRPDAAVATPEAGRARVSVVVWTDAVEAIAADPDADLWLSDALGTPLRLVYMIDPARARPVDPDFGAPGDVVSFADGFPLLVTTQASLDDVNARLARPVPMDRFRTNLRVAGGGAWAEDGWRRLRVGAVTFRVVKDCARCAVTTVDQATGERSPDNEPIRTLAGFRRKAGGRIVFGQNLVPEGRGIVRTGDPVTPLA